MPSSKPSRSTAGGPPWWLILVLIAAIAGGFYWWQRDAGLPWLPERASPTTGPSDAPESAQTGQDTGQGPGARAGGAPPAEEATGPRADGDSMVSEARKPGEPKYPLPAGVTQPGDPSLPPLADSDAPILEALSGAADRTALGRFGNIGDFTRRFVVTVDNLPRKRVPAQYSAVQRIPGPLEVANDGKRTVLSPKNYARYDAFTGFVEQFGAKAMVSLYLRFYPLLQQEYRAMGFPDGHFNDRVIEAIDDMLAAPRVEGPIELVQPRVHLQFADPKLESLSAGRKIMLRVGPSNAERLEQVLREIRAELVP